MKKGRQISIFDKPRFLIWRAKTFFKALVLHSWRTILWLSYLAIFTILVILAYRFRMEGWNHFGIILTVLFGLISGISLIVSITVLHSIREAILDYVQAGPSFEEIIEASTSSTLVLTENPAFLQAVSTKALDSWLDILKEQLNNIHYNRIIFAYIYREHLVAKKIKEKWAPAIGADPVRMSIALKSTYTFSLCKSEKTCLKVFCIPMKTTSFKFYIAVADTDRAAIFCNSREVDPNVKKWKLKGFRSYDPYIISGIREVFFKFLQLSAAVYMYECKQCAKVNFVYLYGRKQNKFIRLNIKTTNPLQIYLFDHDLFHLDEIRSDISFDAEQLEKTPIIPCPECDDHKIEPILVELREVRVSLLNQAELSMFAGVDLPKNMSDKWSKDGEYSLAKALFWIVTEEVWED